MYFFKTIVLFFLITRSLSQLLNDDDYCNLSEECISGCCLNKRCEYKNNCLALANIESYVGSNYCDISAQCDSKCCLLGECLDYDECFIRYDLPILMGIVGGVAAGLLMLLLGYIFTPRKKQPPPPPVIEEEIVDDLNGPIYYEGEEEPQPTPEPPVVPDKFEDNVEIGYYDEKTVRLAN